MPIVANAVGLRQFLVDVGTKVTLYWKPKGKRFYQLDRGRLTAEFGKNFMAGRSNTSTRVHNLGSC